MKKSIIGGLLATSILVSGANAEGGSKAPFDYIGIGQVNVSFDKSVYADTTGLSHNRQYEKMDDISYKGIYYTSNKYVFDGSLLIGTSVGIYTADKDGQALIEWDILQAGFSPLNNLHISASAGASVMGVSEYTAFKGSKLGAKVDWDITDSIALNLSFAKYSLSSTKENKSSSDSLNASSKSIGISYKF